MYQKVLSAHQSLEDGGRGSWRGRVRGRGRRPGRKLLRIHRDPMTELPEDMLVCQDKDWGASLVAQWLRICLPMQGTQVRALVWEDPTCRGATRPVSHNY